MHCLKPRITYFYTSSHNKLCPIIQDENHQNVKILTKMLTIREVTVISSKIKKDEEDGGVAGEWKYAAMVMDRLVFPSEKISDDFQTLPGRVSRLHLDLVLGCFLLCPPCHCSLTQNKS